MKLNVELRVTSVRDTSVFKIMSMGEKSATGIIFDPEKETRGEMGLWPYHPEWAGSHLISEARQGRSWLVFGWKEKWCQRLTYQQ